MKQTHQYCVWFAILLYISGSALGQSTVPNAKPVSAETQHDDACFKIPLSAPVLAKHLQILLQAVPASMKSHAELNGLLSSAEPKDLFEPFPGKGMRASPTLLELIQSTSHIVDESSVPMLIKKGAILPAPPQPNPSPSPSVGIYQPIQPSEDSRMLNLAQSVGKLQVRDEGPNGPWVGLGTAFVVAHGVIATNCHVISDFVTGTSGNWELYPKYANSFAVDFSDDGSYSAEHGFRVTGMYAPPEEVGLDVVFLSVEEKNSHGSILPYPIPLASKRLTDASLNGDLKMVALIGYPSPSDGLDRQTAEMYGRFDGERFGKFVVPGGITTVQSCQKPLDVILDTISTTSGQSGSPVVDRSSGMVVGIHTCCEDYELRAPASTLPIAYFPCASKRDTVNNQAVSSWSVWQEPNLARVLQEHGQTGPTPNPPQ